MVNKNTLNYGDKVIDLTGNPKIWVFLCYEFIGNKKYCKIKHKHLITYKLEEDLEKFSEK